MGKEEKTIRVRVVPLEGGAKVVKENTVGRYHTEADGVFEVPDNAYYNRKLSHGELERAAAPAKPKPPRRKEKPDKPKEGDEQ
jgi:hypothetical protein